ncbi:MAG: c-type cytochrome [Saprospiraceae bacterium]|nr:c-type cytochrome [Saprospiraceae bacterium]
MKPRYIFNFLLFTFLVNNFAFSQDKFVQQQSSDGHDTLRMVLLTIGIILFVVIVVLGNTLTASYRNFIKNKMSGYTPWAFLIISFLGSLVPNSVSAQGSMDMNQWINLPYDVWIYLVIVFLEILVIIFLSNKIRSFLNIGEKNKEYNRDSWWVRFFYKLNNFRPIEEEAQFDVGHDYDGIRELDNKTPAWWNWSFLFCIIFAGVYMYRYHIAQSAPLPLEEYKIALAEAAVKKAEYLKNSAELIDETNVTMSDEAGIAIGANLYLKNCVVCHGAKGEGGIGPNMTDDYWIHKGSLKDIFYSIKYGWPQNGMKGWSEDFSPSEIAHVSSYVKTLVGTNPPNQKDKQGDFYKEDGIAKDSISATQDTLNK